MQFDEMAPLTYDYLVLGLGAEVNFFGAEGAAEHAFPMYTLTDAVRLKEHVLERWEAADKDPRSDRRRRAQRRRRRRRPDRRRERRRAGRALPSATSRRTTRSVPQDKARVILVEAGPELFSMFKPNLRATRVKALEKLGVEVMTGEIVASVTPTRVTLKSGTVLEAHTLVWGAGLHGNRLVQSLGLELQRGNRIARRPGADGSRATRRSTSSATSPRSPTRRPSRCSRSSARSRCSRASTPARRSRRLPRRQGDEAVQVPRQGNDGDDRPRRSRRPDARRPNDEGHDGAARLGHRASRAPAHERGPREGDRRLGGRRVHAPARRAGSRSDRRRGGGDR